MKKVLSMALVALMCLSFTACGEPLGVPTAPTTTTRTTMEYVDSEAYGVWTDPDGNKWLFNVTGELTIFNADGGQQKARYNVAGTRMTLIYDNEAVAVSFVVSGDQMTLLGDDGSVLVLTRAAAAATSANTTAATAATQTTRTTGVVTSSLTAADLVGSWYSSSDGTMVLNASGTAALGTDGATWALSGNVLTITLNSGSSVSVVCSLSGNTLTLTDNQGNVVATYTKQ